MRLRNPEPDAGQPEPHRHAGGVRCFLAVPLAEPALGAAQQLQAELRERVGDVRWARPETLHLTVHFFGVIDDGRVTTALELVAPIADGTAAFEVALDRLGAFPPRGTPRVLWLGATRDIAPLTALALECRKELAAAGFEVEARPYQAHCTLGRPRMRWNADARAAWTAAASEDQTRIGFTASRLVLYESRTAPGGAMYTERASLTLALR